MSIALDSPMAEALSTAVHSKIVEEGWTQDDDTSLAEYIVLMLANGKTQDQIASELAGELLQDSKGTTEFAQWAFDQVNLLSGGSTSAPAATSHSSSQPAIFGAQASDATDTETSSIPAAYDMDMVDNAPENAPRGPKGLHGGRGAGRAGRGGAITKSTDSILHRIRANDRINSHANVRGAPKGPRSVQNRDMRPGMQKALNGMGLTGPQGMQNAVMMHGAQQGQGMMQMSPHQQMEFMAMMEQQTRMLAQFTGMMPGAGNGFPQGQQTSPSRSLFDRIEPGRGRGGRGRGRGGLGQNGHIKSSTKTSDSDAVMEGDGQATAGDMTTTEGQESGDTERKPQDPSTTMCHFNLRCTNADCAFVHQSPAAPEGTIVDMSENCTFGPACKNAKCVAKHPSPAKVRAFQAQETCKFFPNCTKPNCPFKHPSMPLCRFGASCKTANCPFTHLQTACRFNPCTNLKCPYKHEPGQQKTTNFADYTWTPEKQTDQDATNQHVSDRKYVDEQAGEELIKPEGNMETQTREEMIT